MQKFKSFVDRAVRRVEMVVVWGRAKGQYSSGIVEGFNNKAKLTTRKSDGFRTHHATEIALYHALGAVPARETAHAFF